MDEQLLGAQLERGGGESSPGSAPVAGRQLQERLLALSSELLSWGLGEGGSVLILK